jgi:hypothetical protein
MHVGADLTRGMGRRQAPGIALGACLQALVIMGASGGATAQVAAPPPSAMTIEEICSEPDRLVGKEVTVTGAFQGWTVAGCAFPPAAADRPVTRGDWLVRTGSACMYVTAGRPDRLQPGGAQDLGRPIELRAVVMRDRTGGLYLSYRGARTLP